MTDTATIVSLPRQMTPLIGRQSELAAILSLIRDGQQLITITGIGGMGKTRLAHQVALEMEPDFTNGALFLPLADIRNADQIPQEIARILGSSSGDTDIEALINLIGNDTRLLVLDNLEHITGAGETVSEILQRLPNLTVLCTSQIPLDIEGEQLFPLDPMMTPGEGETAEGPAIELFVQRAKAANPHQQFADADLSLVAEICRMLDGIPLAIELAAGRTSIFSLPELRNQLDHRLDVLGGGKRSAPERQRTMRNAIAWSYDLLDDDEKRIFRYICVYSGGIEFDAITHTLQTLEITDTTPDVIGHFITRGLLRRQISTSDSPQYIALQTLREYGIEQLAVAGDEYGARLAHANFVLTLVVEASPHLGGPNQPIWFDRMRENSENMLQATTWAANNRPEITLQIIAAAWRFFSAMEIGESYIALGDRAVGAPIPETILLDGLMAIGMLEIRRGHDQLAAEDRLQHALDLAVSLGDHRTEATLLNALGTVAVDRHDFDQASKLHEQSANLSRNIGHLQGLYGAQANLASVAHYRGDNEAAVQLLEEALTTAERLGDPSTLAIIYSNLGTFYGQLNNLGAARRNLEHAAQIARQNTDISSLRYALHNLGSIHASLNNIREARECMEECILICQQAARPTDELDARSALALFLVGNDIVGDALKQVVTVLSSPLIQDAPVPIVACGCAVVHVHLHFGQEEAAATLLGAIYANEQTLMYPIETYSSDSIKEFTTSLQTAEDPNLTFAFSRGGEWSLEHLRFETLQHSYDLLELLGTAPPSVGNAEAIPNVPPLTTREQEVLSMMAQGRTNAEIAEEMYISLRTITTHASNIFAKLEVKNRSSAVAVAQQAGLLPTA